MKRDLDFIREFLLKAEADEEESKFVFAETILDEGQPVDLLPAGWDWKTAYHFELLKDAGFVKEIGFEYPTGPQEHQETGFIGRKKFRLTNAGHDYLDTVRDEQNWKAAKDAAKDAGGFTLGLIGEIAKGIVRAKLNEMGVLLA